MLLKPHCHCQPVEMAWVDFSPECAGTPQLWGYVIFLLFLAQNKCGSVKFAERGRIVVCSAKRVRGA